MAHPLSLLYMFKEYCPALIIALNVSRCWSIMAIVVWCIFTTDQHYAIFMYLKSMLPNPLYCMLSSGLIGLKPFWLYTFKCQYMFYLPLYIYIYILHVGRTCGREWMARRWYRRAVGKSCGYVCEWLHLQLCIWGPSLLLEVRVSYLVVTGHVKSVVSGTGASGLDNFQSIRTKLGEYWSILFHLDQW